MTGRPWGIKTKIVQASYILKNSETVEKINVTKSYKYTIIHPCKVILKFVKKRLYSATVTITITTTVDC